MAKGRAFGAGPQSTPRRCHEDDPARRGQDPDRLGHQCPDVIGFLKRVHDQHPVEAARSKRQGPIIDQHRAVPGAPWPGLDPLPRGHGGDQAARAHEGTQPRRGIANAEDVTAVGLAPGGFQPFGQQSPDQPPGRLAIEQSEVLDRHPHGHRIAPDRARLLGSTP